jgi:hypothetical protein
VGARVPGPDALKGAAAGETMRAQARRTKMTAAKESKICLDEEADGFLDMFITIGFYRDLTTL